GVAEAIETFGKSAFYRDRKAIYDAGCNFATPLMISEFDVAKLQKFALELNSPYVVNSQDDERDSTNLLNLISAFES
ncbi:MAG: phage replication protein, partial [Cyanobacteria bacterium J06649_11]